MAGLMKGYTMHRNLSGLGKGWQQECCVCKKMFHSVSNKQVVCSADCRFELYKVEKQGCWGWSGPKLKLGYGVLSLNTVIGEKAVTSAHRFSYSKYKGVIPDGLCVMHICDNPSCINPNHLVLGTRGDNNTDRSVKGRSGTKHYSDAERKRYSGMTAGEKNPMAKLTEVQAIKIKYEHKDLSSRVLAELYNISLSLVKNIRSNNAWKHI